MITFDADDKHVEIHGRMRDFIMKELGSDMNNQEVLALAAYLLGQVMACQDPVFLTTEQAWMIARTNIVNGNRDMSNQIVREQGGIN